MFVVWTAKSLGQSQRPTSSRRTNQIFPSRSALGTVRVDSANQADAVDPFRWVGLPQMRILSWSTSTSEDVLQAECRYRGLIHKRYFHFVKPVSIQDLTRVLDERVVRSSPRTPPPS